MKDDLTDPDVEQGQVYSYLRWPISHIAGIWEVQSFKAAWLKISRYDVEPVKVSPLLFVNSLVQEG